VLRVSQTKNQLMKTVSINFVVREQSYDENFVYLYYISKNHRIIFPRILQSIPLCMTFWESVWGTVDHNSRYKKEQTVAFRDRHWHDTDSRVHLYKCEFTLWILTDQAKHITSRDLGVAVYATLVKVNDLVFLMTSGNQLLDRRAEWIFSIDFQN